MLVNTRGPNRVFRTQFVLGVVIAGAIGVYAGRHAKAIGIPSTNTLTYSGTLLTFGVPDNSSHSMSAVLLVGGVVECTQAAQSVTAVNGQFTLPLASTCEAVILANPSASVQLTVDGTAMPATPITAVPYAVEAASVDMGGVTGVLPITNGGTGSSTQNFVPETSAVGAASLPSGSTTQRVASPTNGMIRYNTTTSQIEAYVNGAWTQIESGTSRTHVEWGNASCASGAPAVYTGIMAAQFYNNSYSPNASQPMCLDTNINVTGSTWQPWDDGLVYRINGGQGWDYVNGQVVSCAVCPGAELVDWGVATCPTGWNTAYAGHLGGIANGWDSGWTGSGGNVCMNDTSWTAWQNCWNGNGMLWRADQANTNRGSYLNADCNVKINCSVCYQ